MKSNPKSNPNAEHPALAPMTLYEKFLTAMFALIANMLIAKWQIDRHAFLNATLDQMHKMHNMRMEK